MLALPGSTQPQAAAMVRAESPASPETSLPIARRTAPSPGRCQIVTLAGYLAWQARRFPPYRAAERAIRFWPLGSNDGHGSSPYPPGSHLKLAAFLIRVVAQPDHGDGDDPG